MTDAVVAAPRDLTPHVPLRRIEIVVNPKSGGVGPDAAEEVAEIMSGFACATEIVCVEPPRVAPALEAAFGRDPDLVVVLAGDGTARSAAALAGPTGPLIAPLPGGTMNMLPKALYGTTDWRLALEVALTQGVVRSVPGGDVQGRPFYVAAMLGSPALWAPAREAVRARRPKLAWLYGRRAMRRAFTGRVRFTLEGEEFHRAEALTLITPLVSKLLPGDAAALEAAVIDPGDAADAFRLAASALFADWRRDESVETRPVTRVQAWSRSRIPAILDGEPVQLEPEVEVRFLPEAFRALAPPPGFEPVPGSA